MKRRMLLLVTSFCLVYSSVAEGVNWARIGESEDGIILSVDAESKENVSADLVRIRTKFELTRPKPDGSKRWSNISYYTYYNEFDCKEGKYRVLQMSYYFTDGTTQTANAEDASRWNHVRPGEVFEGGLYKFVCK
jgi:hypothetical protein